MRKSKAKKREIVPDPRFNDVLVAKFINNMMIQGKKETARKIFYDAIDIVDEKVEEESISCEAAGLTELFIGSFELQEI